MTTNDAIVTCENLVKLYRIDDLEVMALQGLDLTIKRGEVMAFVGSSGSGKTTLLNVIGGLDRPTAGKLIVANNDLLKLSDSSLDAYRRQYVGFIWQQKARNLIPYLDVEQNIELPMIMSGIPPKQRKEWIGELIDAVRLNHRRGDKLAQLLGVNNNGSPLPSPWPIAQPCYSATNQPANSTHKPPKSFSTSSMNSTGALP
jgi:ABC-type lipoprotein export system ATPase subunit